MRKRLPKTGDNVYIPPRTAIVGKWHKNRYIVKRKVGSGMVGSVYLCTWNNNIVALKISEQSMSMTTEVNVLKSLNKVQDKLLGPYLFDVDDWELQNGKTYSFYVMEYIKGEPINDFIHQNGPEWVGLFVIQILDQLENLHSSGWVFGDLKNDNLLVEHPLQFARFIDVGGTTKIGKSIREYSEFYDRAYWGLGKRLAEPSYDLFALVMVFLTIFYPNQFKRTHNSQYIIQQKISSVPELRLFQRSFQKAIDGHFTSAKEMKQSIIMELVNSRVKHKPKQKKVYIFDLLIVLTWTTIQFIVLYMLF